MGSCILINNIRTTVAVQIRMPSRSRAVADAKEPSVHSKKCLKRTSPSTASLSIPSHSPAIVSSGHFIRTICIFLTSHLQSWSCPLDSCKLLAPRKPSGTSADLLLQKEPPFDSDSSRTAPGSVQPCHVSTKPSLFQARKNQSYSILFIQMLFHIVGD